LSTYEVVMDRFAKASLQVSWTYSMPRPILYARSAQWIMYCGAGLLLLWDVWTPVSWTGGHLSMRLRLGGDWFSSNHS